MILNNLKSEFDMYSIDEITTNASVKTLDEVSSLLNDLYIETMKKLLEKNYISKDYFINYDYKVVEMEDEDNIKISVFVIQCSAKVFKPLEN